MDILVTIKLQKLRWKIISSFVSDIPFDQRSLVHREASFPSCDRYVDIATYRLNRPRGQLSENPAYGRNRISRRVQIVAKIQKKSNKFKETKIQTLLENTENCFIIPGSGGFLS